MNLFWRHIWLFISFFFFQQHAATAKVKASINTGWQFHKGATSVAAKTTDWEPVTLPHSWNTKDVMDDEHGYYRGVGMYHKTIFLPENYREKSVYLFFEGAAQVAAVYVNGKLAGEHTGSYTAFRVLISPLLHFDGKSNANEIVVKLDNSHSENIPPLSADFTFYGGIYRDVYLEAYEPIHFDADNYASDGVFITTPKVSAAAASVTVKGKITNSSALKQKLLVRSTLLDAAGNVLSQQQSNLTSSAGTTVAFAQSLPELKNPHLWSIDDPYRYLLHTTITDANGKICDEQLHPLGLRWFEFTADKGFFLNGTHIKLWGASRHQDYPDMANALPDAMQVKDVASLKAMGGNLLRVAHYPQDPEVLEACDMLGIITSVEIPVVNAITENDTFRHNCLEMQTEMIRQNYNYTSVMIWAYMNEVLLRLRYADDKPRQDVYIRNVKALAFSIDSLTRKEDPSRYTMIPFHGDQNLYQRAGLTEVPQIIGWNQYSGWYGADINDFAKNMDRHFRDFKKPVIVTEFGADGDPRLRSFHPQRFDKTLEYETWFHKIYIDVIGKRDFIAGGMMWNLADFNAEARNEAMPHVNNKGLLTFNRQPKDAYLYYQSQLLRKPFLKIGSRSWVLRSGNADGAGKTVCTQPVEVFTNQQGIVKLTLNGKLLGSAHVEQGVATFNVPFEDGTNQLEASMDAVLEKDLVNIHFLLQPFLLKDTAVAFREINVSLGDQRFFNDDKVGQVWLPEQAYTAGSWGYIGGEVFLLKNSRRQPYGSDKNILETDYDPIYETQRTDIEQFKLDVPSGHYELNLLFAELLSNALRDANVYNLDNGHNTPVPEKPEERSMDIIINGKAVISGLGSDNYLLPETAYKTKLMVDVTDEKGITIEFKAIKGHTMLNGLQLRKL